MSSHHSNSGTGQRPAVYDLIVIGVLVALGVLAYANTLQAPFLFDDMHNIVENPYIRIKELSYGSLAKAAAKSPASSRWLPNMSFAVNYYLAGMAVQSYHFVNIGIHILCGIILYYLALVTLSLDSLKRFARHARQIAFWGTLIWLLHPVQTNGVTYIVQRMTSMAALFFLLALLAYAIGRQQNTGKRNLLFVLSVCSGFLAVISKENGVMLPVMILGYELFFVRQSKASIFTRNYLFLGLALILLGAVVSIFYFGGNNPFVSAVSGYESRDFTLGQRLLTQPRVIIHYLSLLFWPLPERMNLSYDFLVSKALLVPPTTALAILCLATMTATVFLLFSRNRLLSFAIFWFLGNLLIESSIIPLEIIFEHRMYLPSTIVIIAIVAVLFTAGSAKTKSVSVVLACIAAVLVFLTWQRNDDWRSEVSMWSDVVEKSPNLARAHVNLGKALVRENRYDEAQEILQRSIRLDPDSGNGYMNLAIVLEHQNRPGQALVYANKALETGNADPAKVHQVKGLAYGKLGDLQAAIREMEEALRYRPDSAQIHVNLGIVYGRSGSQGMAEKYFRQAAMLDPDNGFALQNLGIVLEKQQRIPEAIKAFEQALTKPVANPAAIYTNLGNLYLNLNNFERALSYAQKATMLNPDLAQGYVTAGLAYEMMEQDQQAFSQFRTAWGKGYNMPALYNQWAEREFNKGNYDRALLYLNEALKLSPADPVTRENIDLVRQAMAR